MEKIYDVRWEDGDGEQGYYVKMTKAESDKTKRFLDAAAAADTIKNPTIGAIGGERLLTAKQLTEEFKERYPKA